MTCFSRIVLLFSLISIIGCSAFVNTDKVQAQSKEFKVLQDRSDRLLVELPNRLLVLVQEVHASPVVSVQTWIKTGSIYEQEHCGKGLSHYLEHLLSGGTTETRAEKESNVILGRIGAQTNAATSLDTVRYYINCTSAHTETAVDLMSDWMQNGSIDQREFERERTVIRREFEMGRGEPRRILWKLTQQARFKVHPARHPTIGYEEDYEKVTRDEIYDFYRRMYVPNNMVFCVVGDVDRHKVVNQIAKLWANSSSRELPKIDFPVEEELTEPRVVDGRADLRAPRIRMAWPGTRLGGEGDYAMDLMSVILGEGETSRLVREVRDGKRLVNAVSAFNYSTNWGEGFFAIDAEIAQPKDQEGGPEDAYETAIEKARTAILEQVQKLRTEGVTEAELALAKRRIIASVVFSAQTVEDMAQRLSRDLIGMGDPDYLQRWAKAIEKVTARDIAVAADRFLAGNRLISITLRPFPKGEQASRLSHPPDEADASKLKREPVDLDNTALITKLESKKLVDGAARSLESGDVRKVTLKNGLRVLIQRNTMVPAVSIQMYHLGGLLADEPGKQGVANAVAVMQTRGTKTRSAQEIARTIENLGASLSTHCGNNSHYATSICLKDDWSTVMEVLADITINPSFPEDEWKKTQPRLVAAIRRQQDDWYQELRGHFRKAYFGEHPWSTTAMGSEDVVSGLSTNDLRDFHSNHLGAKDSVLAVFGDIDPDVVVAKVEELFGSMPSTRRVAFKPPSVSAPAAQLKQFETRKPLAAVQMAFGPVVPRDHADFARIEVMRRVLSSFPSGWLDQKMRGEGEGLVYAVWAGQFTGVQPGYFAAAFNCTPAKMSVAMEGAAAVIDRIRNEKVDDETLARAKEAVLSRQFMAKQSNGDRATEYALNELYGLPLDESERFEKAVRVLDADAIQAVAKKYLRNPVIVAITHKKAEEEKLKAAVKSVFP